MCNFFDPFLFSKYNLTIDQPNTVTSTPRKFSNFATSSPVGRRHPFPAQSDQKFGDSHPTGALPASQPQSHSSSNRATYMFQQRNPYLLAYSNSPASYNTLNLQANYANAPYRFTMAAPSQQPRPYSSYGPVGESSNRAHSLNRFSDS